MISTKCILLVVLLGSSVSYGQVLAYSKLYGKPMCAYVANVSVADTMYMVIVDTGSSNLAVPDQSCTSCPSPKYLGPVSTTSISVTYGSGNWSGCVANVSFDIPGTPTISLDIAVMTTEYGFFDPNCPATGIMGMAYQPLATGGLPIAMDVEVKENNMPNAFAFMLCGGTFQLPAKNGHLWWGGYDSSFLASGAVMQQAKILEDTWYTVSLQQITIGGNAVQFTNRLSASTTIIDSGTTQIVFSSAANLNAFIDALKGSGIVTVPVSDTIFWSGEGYSQPGYSINNNIIITFYLLGTDGKEIPINIRTSNLFEEIAGKIIFHSYLLGQNTDPYNSLNILGIAFLEGQVVYFNRKDNYVGFAPGISDCNNKTSSTAGINVIGPTGLTSTATGLELVLLVYLLLVCSLFHLA